MSEYLDELEKIRIKKDLDTKRLQKELARHYMKISEKYEEELKKQKPGSIKEAWIQNQRKSIAKKLEEIGKAQEDVITKSMQNTINNINKSTEDFFNKAAKEGKLPPDLFTGMFTSANDSIVKVILAGGLYKDGKGLSERLWNHNRNFGKDIQSVITEGLTDKQSPYDIAKNLGQFLNPDTRKEGKYPKNGKGKNVEYNAYRLANASISHAYQTALSRVNDTNPFINGLEWDGGHESTSCQICKDRRGKVYGANKNRGVKYTTEPPPLDHPNGFCKLIPVIPDSMEDIGKRLNKWANGESDPTLDKWYAEHGQKYQKGPNGLIKREDNKSSNAFKAIEDKYGIKINIDNDLSWMVDKLDLDDISDFLEGFGDLFKKGLGLDFSFGSVEDDSVSLRGKELVLDIKRLIEMAGGKGNFNYSAIRWDLAERFSDAFELAEKYLEGLSSSELDKMFSGIKGQVGEKYWLDIKQHIGKAPEHIKKWWALGSDYFKYLGEEGSSAYYSPPMGGIVMDINGEKNNRRNPYTTFFHEFGHLIDHQVGKSGASSKSKKFYYTIQNDYQNVLRSMVPEEMWKEKPSVAEELAKRRLNNQLKGEKDYISGVSDIIGGLTNNEVKGIWGHTVDYWNRGNKENEITSEMWAHMSSCYANDDNYKVMKKYFPESLKEFEKQIKKQISQEMKKKV